MSNKVLIRRLDTGIPGLDNLLGGGVPEFSFNLIVGAPGSGKTTLAHQLMFALSKQDKRALFFSVLGEPALKMLRYQQQFHFFDGDKINQSIRYINLSNDLLKNDFKGVLQRINAEMQDFSPSFVFVDSFRSLLLSSKHGQRGGNGEHGEQELQNFVQELCLSMASWQATSFLIGEYAMPESSAVFTVADGIILLSQNLTRDSLVRKIQIVKIRGQAPAPGLHTFRITDAGIVVYPRAIVSRPSMKLLPVDKQDQRMSIGVAELDQMLGGGLPRGYSLLVVGPSGCGKTVLASQFLAEGARIGEPGVIAAFEKSPSQLLSKQLYELIAAGKVGMLATRSLDLSIDQTLHDLIAMIVQMKAKRLVIDSLSGFELAVTPTFSEDFRSSLYRMVAELTAMDVTILMTSELEDRYTDLRFSPFGSAFLADAIILQRYVELDSQFQRVLSVVKVRGSQHSKDLRLFEINDEGIQIGQSLAKYNGILSGKPEKHADQIEVGQIREESSKNRREWD